MAEAKRGTALGPCRTGPARRSIWRARPRPPASPRPRRTGPRSPVLARSASSAWLGQEQHPRRLAVAQDDRVVAGFVGQALGQDRAPAQGKGRDVLRAFTPSSIPGGVGRAYAAITDRCYCRFPARPFVVRDSGDTSVAAPINPQEEPMQLRDPDLRRGHRSTPPPTRPTRPSGPRSPRQYSAYSEMLREHRRLYLAGDALQPNPTATTIRVRRTARRSRPTARSPRPRRASAASTWSRPATWTTRSSWASRLPGRCGTGPSRSVRYVSSTPTGIPADDADRCGRRRRPDPHRLPDRRWRPPTRRHHRGTPARSVDRLFREASRTGGRDAHRDCSATSSLPRTPSRTRSWPRSSIGHGACPTIPAAWNDDRPAASHRPPAAGAGAGRQAGHPPAEARRRSRAERPAGPTVDESRAQGVIPDDRLRLIFTCCHPALAPRRGWP